MKRKHRHAWLMGFFSVCFFTMQVHAVDEKPVSTRECVRLVEIDGGVAYEVKIRWVKEVVGGKELYRMKFCIKNVTNDTRDVNDFEVKGAGLKTDWMDIDTDDPGTYNKWWGKKRPWNTPIKPNETVQWTSDKPYRPETVQFIEVEFWDGITKCKVRNSVFACTCINGQPVSASQGICNHAVYPVHYELSVSGDYSGWNPVLTQTMMDIPPDSICYTGLEFRVPDLCTYGNKFEFTCYNVTDNDTSLSERIAYLTTDEPDGFSVSGADTLQYQWTDITGNVVVDPGASLTVDNSVIRMMTYNGFISVEPGGQLSLSNCTVEPDSGQRIYYIMYSGDGGVHIENTSIIGSDNGIAIVEGANDLYVDDLAVSNCYYLGIELAGCGSEQSMAKRFGRAVADDPDMAELSCVIVDSIAGTGILIDFGSRCKLTDAWIGEVGGYDLVVKDSSEAYMLSSVFDENNVFVEPGSRLTRAWWFTGILIDADSSLPESHDITILDSEGRTVFQEIDAEGGLFGPTELIQWEDTGEGSKMYKTPHTISATGHFSWGDWDTTFTVILEEDSVVGVQATAATGIPAFTEQIPKRFKIYQNYPNPFNPETRIRFDVSQPARTAIHVYNTGGQRIRTLVDETKQPGSYEILWDAKDDRGHVVSSGVYLIRFESKEMVQMKKVVLLR